MVGARRGCGRIGIYICVKVCVRVRAHWERGQSGEKARGGGRLKEKVGGAGTGENGDGKKMENRNRTKQEGTATEERAARQIEKEEGAEGMTR